MRHTTATGLQHIWNWEGIIALVRIYNGFPDVLNKFPLYSFSFLQAEADCTKAINLDKKVSFYS